MEFPYEIQNANATTTVDVFAGGNYAATVNEAEKKIVVTPPTPAVNGSVLAWAQNEEGLFSMKKLSFIVKAETEVKTTQEELEAISGEAGDFVVNVVSNIDIDVETPTVDWVSVAVTKADYKITLTLAENTTDAPRETEIIVVRKDNGAQVQKIKIVQLVADNTPMPDANPGDILWSEDWTVEKDGIMLDDYTFTGTKVFNDYKVKYSAVKPEDGSDIKVYLDTQMGGDTKQGNLLLSKNGGTWTISGIPSGNATQAVLTFKTNAKDRLDGVTSDTEGVTMGEMVAPTEKSKPYSYAYDITLAAGVTKFNLTFTCNNSNNVRLDDIVLKVPEAAEKVLTLERQWSMLSTTDTKWYTQIAADNAAFNADGQARSVAMDDDYIYLPKSSGYAAIIAVSLADKTQMKRLNTTGFAGTTFQTSFARIVKNTDASVNGGKDILLVSNLSAGDETKPFEVRAFSNGINEASVRYAAFIWDSANNVNDWRRYGDRFFVTGTYQSGAVYCPAFEEKKSVILGITNGARSSVTQIATADKASGIIDVAVYPEGSGILFSNVSTGIFAKADGTKTNNWDTYAAEAVDAAKKSFGYNFFTFNEKKYIARVVLESETKARLQIFEDTAGTEAGFLAAIAGTPLFEAPLQSESDFTADSPASSTLADCSVRVMSDHVLIAGLLQNGGLSLFKMYLK